MYHSDRYQAELHPYYERPDKWERTKIKRRRRILEKAEARKTLKEELNAPFTACPSADSFAGH
jgi:hypothetical protein